MPEPKPPSLSRRERQIAEIIYRLGSMTGAEVLEAMPDAPSYSALRGTRRSNPRAARVAQLLANYLFVRTSITPPGWPDPHFCCASDALK
jgi:hypothetical protein